MIYFDTNILVYSTIEDFDKEKHDISKDLIINAIRNKQLFLSPMVISEFVYVLSKSKIDSDIIKQEIDFFYMYVNCVINKDLVKSAFELTNILNRNTSINDGVHVKIAEKYCNKLITFDKGYNTFINKVSLDIEIL